MPIFGDGGKDGIPDYILPVELGEMTGRFDTKAEQTLSLMLRLMKKMMIDKHRVWTHCRTSFAEIWNGLKELRMFHWLSGIIFFPCNIESEVESVFSYKTAGLKIHKEVVKIEQYFEKVRFEEVGPFRPWETFTALYGIHARSHNEGLMAVHRMISKDLGFPYELKNQTVLPGQFSEMWSKVLELLPGRLAPIQDLRKALCFGLDLTKRCYGCFNDFTVEEIFWIPSLMPNKDTTTPSYTLDRLFSFCGRCDYKVAMERYLILIIKQVSY